MKRKNKFVPAVVVLLVTFLGVVGCDSGGITSEPTSEGSEGDTVTGNETGNETGNGQTDPDSANNQQPSQEYEARYQVTFNATWSDLTHPINFPNDPHFSPLVGVVHNEQSKMWESGQIASDGMEQMAETGGTSILKTEVQALIDEGVALSVIEGGGIGTSPNSVSVEILINQDYPMVSLVSMLAPSPDWFVGVSGVDLFDAAEGSFVKSQIVGLKLYDAGTDGGMRFTSIDENTDPRSPILLLSSFPMDTDFLDGEPAVGELRFVLLE